MPENGQGEPKRLSEDRRHSSEGLFSSLKMGGGWMTSRAPSAPSSWHSCLRRGRLSLSPVPGALPNCLPPSFPRPLPLVLEEPERPLLIRQVELIWPDTENMLIHGSGLPVLLSA